MITAVVGAGGKTSLIHALTARYRAAGKRVFVTTSTHMYIEADTLLTDDAAQLIEALETTGYVMAGLPRGEKIGPLSRETYEAVCHHADEVLIEADGARHMAVKVPREGEPVIDENVEEIVVVCGLHALGKTVVEAAFHPEMVAEFLGTSKEEQLTFERICTLIRHGYIEPLRRRYPNKKITVHPVTNGTTEQQMMAEQMKREMSGILEE